MITRPRLKATDLPTLLRFARWLGLYIPPEWSQQHVASMIYWKITRR